MATLLPPANPRLVGRLTRIARGAIAATSAGSSTPVPLSITINGAGTSVECPMLSRQASVCSFFPQCTTTIAGREVRASSSGTGALLVLELLRPGVIQPRRQRRSLLVLLGDDRRDVGP